MASNSKLVSVALVALPLVIGYMGYTGEGLEMVGVGGLKAGRERVAAVQDTIARLEAQTDSAKRELANGTVEDLRRRLDVYRGSLALLRRLVPDRNEVPNLLDDISTRAKVRGVNLSNIVPMPVEPGPAPFDTHKYKVSVLGHYDQIGEFLADIASLQRIIVPFDVNVAAAQAQAAKALGDSTGALLEAKFQIRTFVKSATGEGENSGT
jgi:type IV pilus assembly protein PilO